MKTVVIADELDEQIRQLAGQTEDINAFVNNAVRERLERLAEQMLQKEIQAFEEMHPELYEKHRGQFVAIHQGKVIDSDPEFAALFTRVRAKLGATPVLIRPVTDSPTPTLRGPSRLHGN